MGYVSTMIQASSTETEVQFVQRIVDMFTGLDSRITCNTTAAAQYVDNDAKATFDFDINNQYKLRMKRSAINSSQNTQWNFSIVIDDLEYVISNNSRLWQNNSTKNTTVGNGYDKVTAFIDEKFIFIWFGANYGEPVTSLFPTMYGTALITDGTNYYATGVKGTNDIASGAFYKCDDGSSGFALTKVLNFIDQAGTISYLQNMNAPIYANGAPAKFAEGLIASSTRTLGESLFFDGKSYFAVGTNILAENSASGS